MSSAETNFRSQLSGFKWAQGRTDDSPAGRSNMTNGSNSGGGGGEGGGFLSGLTNSLSGYVPLRSSERSNEEEAYLSLSRWERFLGFLACIAGAAVCFFFSFIFLSPPILAVRPQKFALAFSLGSMLFMVGFSILSGPVAHLKHILSPTRLPFSIAYFGSLGLTIYFAVGPRLMLPTLICAIVQVGALVTYLAAYFPGGTTTLRYGGSMLLRGGSSLLPI
ncbi:SFT2-domain-containing protein [Violaceomyces palustris]|uniref:SFT2-domain-containing protein n=1 Tax=Violaceomyces palustris TaxID=1673888 RepID=A0ACD0P468_9BASI|nr:SFT2-domain-containing protein [Violaceomyces palustris]